MNYTKLVFLHLVASLLNLMMNIMFGYFGVVDPIWCSLLLLTGPMRILLGPVFSFTGAVIR